MKRLLILLTLGGLLAAPAAAENGPRTAYVRVDKARLLEKPTAFSRAKSVLPYRTALTVVLQRGAYVQVVTSKGVKGYVPAASLADKKPKFTAKLSKEYVSSDEVAMATKGFNAQVEADYRKKNPKLAFDELNRLEKKAAYTDPAGHFKPFREAGKLGEFAPGGESHE